MPTLVEIAPVDYETTCQSLMAAGLWNVRPIEDVEDMAGLIHLYHSTYKLRYLAVMYANQAPIGVLAIGDEHYHPNGRDRWPMAHAFVAPQWRSQGIATRMLSMAKMYWDAKGQSWQVLGYHNEAAVLLYHRYGIVDPGNARL